MVAGLVAALVLGAGLGAFAVALLDEGSMVVREVTVESPEPVSDDALSVGALYRRASRGVVEITAVSEPGVGGARTRAQGSGFVYDREGHVITNQHVIDGTSSISVVFPNGRSYPARLVGEDRSTDLAVLKVDAPRRLLVPLPLGDSSAVAVGDPVFALGSPFGLEGTITSGIVSALGRRITAPNRFTISNTIQTDAAVNHGNSGGPLLDRRGRVIGVNAQIESESGGSDGVGFAIPSNTVRSIVSQLVRTGRVEHAYLGVEMTAVPEGVAVTEVRPDTPAEDAGLRAATGSEIVDGEQRPVGGDVIVAFDGARIESPADLQAAVDSKRPGDTVSLTVLRNGRRVTVEVTLAVRE